MKKMKLATLSLTLALSAAGLVAAGTGTAQATSFGNIADPGVYFGSGNSNGNWTIDTVDNLEVALRAKTRYGVGVLSASNGFYVVSGDTYINGRAMWNYEFSVNSKVGGTGLDLTNYRVEIAFDTKSGPGTSFTTFTNLYTHWGDNEYYLSGTKRIDSPTDALVGAQPGESGVQNSENPKFADSGFGYVPGNGLYDIKMSVYSVGGGAALASTSMQVQVVPEPETYAMMATGLAVLGFIGRRRKQKVAAAA